MTWHRIVVIPNEVRDLYLWYRINGAVFQCTGYTKLPLKIDNPAASFPPEGENPFGILSRPCRPLFLNQRLRKSAAALKSLDFYAPPLLRIAEAAAAPRESFGFQRGLVAPAIGNGATAMSRQACVSHPCTSEKTSLCLINFFRL
jgi:hypothetical protein